MEDLDKKVEEWCGKCLDSCINSKKLLKPDYIAEGKVTVALKISQNEEENPTILYIKEGNSPITGAPSVTIGMHYFKNGECIGGEFSECYHGRREHEVFIHRIGKEECDDLNHSLEKYLIKFPEEAKEKIKGCFEK
jgi:hypothetical protein